MTDESLYLAEMRSDEEASDGFVLWSARALVCMKHRTREARLELATARMLAHSLARLQRHLKGRPAPDRDFVTPGFSPALAIAGSGLTPRPTSIAPFRTCRT